jgi:hypothetical protein
VQFKSSQRAIYVVLAVISFASAVGAQAPPNLPVGNDFVQIEFGTTCTLNPSVSPVTADLNGDKIEDIVIPARCTNPMRDAAEHDYVVLDPFNAFYGFGDPKITTQYSTEEPEKRDLALLVIHGTGADAWKSKSLKVKFLLVNIPYKQVSVQRYRTKKKTIEAIYVEEATGNKTTSAIFWDGKKYRYDPIGSSLE